MIDRQDLQLESLQAVSLKKATVNFHRAVESVHTVHDEMPEDCIHFRNHCFLLYALDGRTTTHFDQLRVCACSPTCWWPLSASHSLPS
jgi:hypothetical protein